MSIVPNSLSDWLSEPVADITTTPNHMSDLAYQLKECTGNPEAQRLTRTIHRLNRQIKSANPSLVDRLMVRIQDLVDQRRDILSHAPSNSAR